MDAEALLTAAVLPRMISSVSKDPGCLVVPSWVMAQDDEVVIHVITEMEKDESFMTNFKE